MRTLLDVPDAAVADQLLGRCRRAVTRVVEEVGLAGATGLRIGVDVQAVEPVAAALAAHPARYLERVLGPQERTDVGWPTTHPERLAGAVALRFAAKEAVLKVLAPQGRTWRWDEIQARPSHAPQRFELHLTGAAQVLSVQRGLDRWALSCDGDADHVVAFAVGAGSHGPDSGGSRRAWGNTMEQQIRDVLKEHGRIPSDVDTMGAGDDLYRAGLTSHASVNVMLAIEDTFDVEFPDALLKKSTFESIAAIEEALRSMGVESGADA